MAAGVAGGSRHLVLYFKLLIHIHFLIFSLLPPATPMTMAGKERRPSSETGDAPARG
jgi:hypothetical protein